MLGVQETVTKAQGTEEVGVGIRSIVVPLVSGSDDAMGLASAISVANSLQAHLEVVFMRPDPETTYVYAGMGTSERIDKEIRERVDEAGKAAALRHRRQFGRLCRKAGLHSVRKPHPNREATAGWSEVKGDPASVFPAAARNADLAIFTGAVARTDLMFGSLLEATLLGSGNPVLFLPEKEVGDVFDHPLIAWDGGTACVRSISAWLATGARPEEVTILHVSDPGDPTPALDGLSDRFAWHGITARREIRERGFRSSGQVLLEVADELNCGMIVMGGYGRFRYSEALFGGVTRHVIKNSSLPVLMMH